MVIETLTTTEIKDAEKLALASLSRFRHNPNALYRNTLNSHIKGRLGELALEKWALRKGLVFAPHFRELRLSNLCDLEFPNAKQYRRVEVKTWTLDGWDAWGRCIQVSQLTKIIREADAILWCSIDLPYLARNAAIADLERLDVTLRAFSLPEDVGNAAVRMTGPRGKKIENYQLDEHELRDVAELLSALSVS